MATTVGRQSGTRVAQASGFGMVTVGQRRTLLLVAVVAAAGLAAVLGQPRPALLADAELTMLLRGMGAIKAVIALTVIGLVWWRAVAAVSSRQFFGYVGCCALLAASSVLVLKLAILAATSVMFHATLLTLGLLALTDNGLRRGALPPH